MALLRWNGVHEAIEEHVTRTAFFRQTCLLVPLGTERVSVLPQEARGVVYGPRADDPLRAALWQLVIHSAHEERAPSEHWRMFAIWLAAPGLRRTAHRVAARMRADRKDVEGELLLGLLEEIRDCDPQSPAAIGRVLRAVHGRAWSYARSTSVERVVAEVSEERASWDPLRGRGDAGPETPREPEVPPPPAPPEFPAPLRCAGSATRREGERLGVLAEHLDLEDLVFRARRPGTGRRIGTLALRAPGGAR
ncbi:hypothetical protein [Streptomyces sp. NPDC051567]|uniref:hypothetical protein n=1 Tax=Streptomyces sp. NPDC051567 TaxID=3365660 RepID=UPI0037AA7505